MARLESARGTVLDMRYRVGVTAVALTAAMVIGASAKAVDASYPGPGPTVGCSGSAGELSFGGQCVGVSGPSAPTEPASFHHWATSVPVAASSCTPYEVTEWATGIADDSWSWSGSFWSLGGQRVPVLRSTPLEDTGWVWEVFCGQDAGIRYLGYTQLPRHPDPCLPGTAAAQCLPGFNPGAFRAAVAGQVPAEEITATPPTAGLVGVPVTMVLQPEPATAQAVIDATVPDLGDDDLGETIHVEWVVQAAPEQISWTLPDGTTTPDGTWIPQVAERSLDLVATVTYQVTAFGFWSDGVDLHQLATQSVGAIEVTARLPYAVQQVQADLG